MERLTSYVREREREGERVRASPLSPESDAVHQLGRPSAGTKRSVTVILMQVQEIWLWSVWLVYSFIQGMTSWVPRITSVPLRPFLSFKQDTVMEVFVWSWCLARCDKSPALWSHYTVHVNLEIKKKGKENAIGGETKHADRSTWSTNFPSITLVHVRWLLPFPQERPTWALLLLTWFVLAWFTKDTCN